MYADFSTQIEISDALYLFVPVYWNQVRREKYVEWFNIRNFATKMLTLMCCHKPDGVNTLTHQLSQQSQPLSPTQTTTFPQPGYPHPSLFLLLVLFTGPLPQQQGTTPHHAEEPAQKRGDTRWWGESEGRREEEGGNVPSRGWGSGGAGQRLSEPCSLLHSAAGETARPAQVSILFVWLVGFWSMWVTYRGYGPEWYISNMSYGWFSEKWDKIVTWTSKNKLWNRKLKLHWCIH